MASFSGSRSAPQFSVGDSVRAGMPLEEARRRTVMRLGGIERTKEEIHRDRRGVPVVRLLALAT